MKSDEMTLSLANIKNDDFVKDLAKFVQKLNIVYSISNPESNIRDFKITFERVRNEKNIKL
jgi:hypothetical protein